MIYPSNVSMCFILTFNNAYDRSLLLSLKSMYLYNSKHIVITFGKRKKTTYNFNFNIEGSTCDADGEALLDGTNPVPDSYFTASTSVHSFQAAHKARLSTNCPYLWLTSIGELSATPPKFYLQASSCKVQAHAQCLVFKISTQKYTNNLRKNNLLYVTGNN